ncbi:MAG: DUF3047 domain-containing protein [Woeseiaceae bacterium]
MMTIPSQFKSIIFISFILQLSPYVYAESEIVIANFSQQTKEIPKSWDALTFGSIEEHTTYTLVDDNNLKVVKAESMGAASGLTKKITFNPKEYPYLSWRWKVNKSIPGTDVTLKSGDDCAARVYVIFDYKLEDLPKEEQSRVNLYKSFYGKLPPLATLNYIWGNKMALGSIVSSPYTKLVKLVVLKNKSSALQQWHVEERNIYEDYKKAFGEEPKNVISLAIMTDTDNTNAMAESYFGDIIVSKTPRTKLNLVSQK